MAGVRRVTLVMAMTPAPRTDELDRRFDHHPPRERRVVELHESTRAQCKLLAQVFEHSLPDGLEKATAITRLQEAMFWANAAIACHHST